MLGNGLRVLVARQPSVPLVDLRLRVPFAGDESDHPAAAELLADAADRDRPARPGGDRRRAARSARGAERARRPGRLLVAGNALADGPADLLEVLADVLTGAAYPEAEVARERDRLVERITVAGAQPRTMAREALQRRGSATTRSPASIPEADEVAAVGVDRCGRCTAARSCRGQRPCSPWSATSTRTRRSPRRAALGLVDRPGAGHGARAAPTVAAAAVAGPPARLGAVAAAVVRPGVRATTPATGAAAGQPGLRRVLLLALVENIREDKGYTYGAHSASSSYQAVRCWRSRPTSRATSPPPPAGDPLELGRLSAAPPSARRGRGGCGATRSARC